MSKHSSLAVKSIAFDDLLRQCQARVHDVHDIPIADPREFKGCKATSTAHETTNASLLANDTRFFKLRPFTPEDVSCGTYLHGPRYGASTAPSRETGQRVAMDKGGHISRSGWCQIVKTPEFYNAAKISRRSCMPTFARAGDATHRSLSWWRWGNERYSPVNAQRGDVDRLCGIRSADQPTGNPEVRSVRTAFLSQQPRIVALPTQRTNDSRLANSQWGGDPGSHYSGAGVGPGQYDFQCGYNRRGYKAIKQGRCHGDFGLPASLATKRTIAQLVKKHVPYAFCYWPKLSDLNSHATDWCWPAGIQA